ncbi:MAG: UDP-N-acetylenolpyruvoylglucosamine reductase [Deltaproteobacteria bacterium RIFCSPLOWO2_02_FULL_53_8]|nr:MAG: UDP-N-acetylenolpyruvoylglucosamine reductase [Deltaproteobacteria bacterium RIFCSPLOWO2_02_FULL_53_8]
MQYQLFVIQRFKGKVLFDVPMSGYTSWHIGGPADVMAFPADEGDLRDIMTFAESKGFAVYVIGAGTNILVRDGGVRGVVINMMEGFKDITWHDAGEDVKAVAGAGLLLSELLSECKGRGLAGLEFACGIPGALGGAVVMNAGAYGGEMKDVCDGVELVTKKGQRRFVPKDEIGFGYRTTDLPKGGIITRVHLRFKRSDAAAVKERIEAVAAKRKASARIAYPNAGSVFKNPEGNSAGRLIEEAGLKGEVSGGAQVSSAHANYIVNLGNAKARDVLQLMAAMRDRVYSRSGVLLEPEIKVLGED